MEPITVIGIHGSGDVYCGFFFAEGHADAIQQCVQTQDPGADLEITGTIAGHHQLTAAIEATGKFAYVEDLRKREACADCGNPLEDDEDEICVKCDNETARDEAADHKLHEMRDEGIEL